MRPVTLLPVRRDGSTAAAVPALPATAAEALAATVQLYERVGFVPPWISYLAVSGSSAVGICGFVSAPQPDGVEIAYFTFPPHQGSGIATAMANTLVDIARGADRRLIVKAHTLPERNASHRVLEKLGFAAAGCIVHPVDGVVLLWRLPAAAGD
jgi:ribosomal-protein-alanine N-acetyltransferase